MGEYAQEPAATFFKLRVCILYLLLLPVTFGSTEDFWPKLAWLHIPKTGSSFARTLWATHCPELITCDVWSSVRLGGTTAIHDGHGLAPDGRTWEDAFKDLCKFVNVRTHKVYEWAGHAPWSSSWAPYGVTLIRDPVDRLLSAFFFNNGHLFPEPENTKELRIWWKGNITRYAQYHGAVGCQTKLVLGLDCIKPIVLTSYHVQRAILKLKTQFKFVGLTEEWDLTIKLYHRMFGDGPPCDSENRNLRMGKYRNTIEGESARREVKENNLMQREADVELHKAAAEIFWQKVCSYNLDERCVDRLSS